MKSKDHTDTCEDLNILEVQFDGYFLHKVIKITLLSDAEVFIFWIFFTIFYCSFKS